MSEMHLDKPDFDSSCAVCGQQDWAELPYFNTGQSVTTSGIIVHAPLGKAQCRHCGLIQRIGQSFLAHGDFYKNSYHTYFDRPRAEVFEKGRYTAMASWMAEALGSFMPKTILDVGCGSGWMMREMSILYPDSQIAGVEPSAEDAAVCINNGLNVINDTIENAKVNLNKYELVYSNNVIQHSISAKEFINNLKDSVTEDGMIIITCPNSLIPSNEMMWSDQNFSLAPSHLIQIAADLGLHVQEMNSKTGVTSIANKQLIVLSKSGIPSNKFNNYKSFDVDHNIEMRIEYLKGWMSLDQILLDVISGKKNVYNFGASMWSYLLRAYCPKYWDNVCCCVIDSYNGIFMDKSVRDINQIEFTANDIIVLGTEPLSQNALSDKLQLRGINVEICTWNNVVSQ